MSGGGTQGVGFLVGAIAQVGQKAQSTGQQLSGLAGKLADIPGKLTHIFTATLDFINHAAAPISALVGKNQPGRVERFEYLMNNAYAVIGNLLVPVMDAFSNVAKMVGDRMAQALPIFRESAGAIAKMVDATGRFFDKILSDEKLLNAWAITITTVANALTVVIDIVSDFREGIVKLGNVLSDVLRKIPFINRFANEAPKRDPNANAAGFYVQSVDKLNPSQIQDNAIIEGLKQGWGGGEKDLKGNAESIDKNMEELKEMIKDFIMNIFPGFSSVFSGSKIAKSVEKAANANVGDVAGMFAQFLVRGL